jgi:hypothetical protein
MQEAVESDAPLLCCRGQQQRSLRRWWTTSAGFVAFHGVFVPESLNFPDNKVKGFFRQYMYMYIFDSFVAVQILLVSALCLN